MVHLLNPASCTALHSSEWNLLGGIEVVGIFHTHLGSFSCVSVYHKEGPKNGNTINKICRPQVLIFLLYGKRPVDCDQSWNIVAPCQHGFDIWRPTIAHKWHPKDPLLNQSLWRTGNPGPAKSGWKRRGGPKSQRTACQLLTDLTVSKWVIMQRLYLGYPISIAYPMDIQWISQLGS